MMLRGRRSILLPVLAGLAGLVLAPAAFAKDARCFTTDDDYFDCDFVATDRKGSFEISSPGTPTYSLVVDAPGVAFGFVNMGNRNVALPGTFLRSDDDAACWDNDETGTQICAW
jgi:hypothetical protein